MFTAIDPNREDYSYLGKESLKTLSRGYLTKSGDTKTLAIERLDEMITTAEDILGFKLPTLRTGVKRGWFSPSSPNWSNFGAGRGLPISCNGSVMDDSLDSILFKLAEIGKMTQQGAGTSLYMGKLRPFGSKIASGGTSDGPTHFARLVQEYITVISQSNVRRGSCCVYLDVDHADIDDWLLMRSTTGGVHHPIQHLDFAVNLTDEFMESLETDPKGSRNRNLMAKIRNKRRETGRPFIFFPGNANRNLAPWFKRAGLKVLASNLCTEIMLPSTPYESFVCNLSSVNLLFYHEWKGTNFIREVLYYLDAVMSDYIDKTANMPFMDHAHASAKRWRALGLGVLGYHSMLQSRLVPFESPEAFELNNEIFAYIQEESLAASRDLARIFGEPEGMEGTGYRNATVNAIAPTQSSSIICGTVSKSIEPWEAVIFENDNAKGVFTQYNPFFVELAQKRGKDTPAMWESVMRAGGRVDHLDWLTQREKDVFKPWIDISQKAIVQQAIDRQVYIDQGQSLNIVLPLDATMKEDVDLIKMAHKGGLKSLYYRNGENPSQKLAREACVACEA